MSKTIRMTLATDSLGKAIQELKSYREQFKFKNSVFVQRLADLGIVTIDANKYGEGDSDFSDLKSGVIYSESGDKFKATLVLNGKDVAFIEFGAGIHYNTPVGTSPNPLGRELGMTIGSYGLGRGANDSWTYKDEATGEIVESHGTKAAMPLYSADEAIRKQFFEIAKEVFQS